MVAAFAYGDSALLEEYVAGTEVAVSVVDLGDGPRAWPAVEIQPRSGIYDYAARYTAGETEFCVPARIGKDQPARVARDEVVVPAQAVKKLGKGNPKRGADKLYALMDKAHKARKKAKRGQDTGLRKGLA